MAQLLRADSVLDKSRLYRTALFMGFSAIMASVAIIWFYNDNVLGVVSAGISSRIQLAVLTLMPYMISAVISAITAIGVMAILPTTRVAAPVSQLVARLKEISDGDLTVRVRLEGEDPLKDVGTAFNGAVSCLADQIAHWKIVNRQQWGVLCRIRQAVEEQDQEQALRFICEMEQNWDRIAEIEHRLIA
jgi:methyl-accepting chemotaxis protein